MKKEFKPCTLPPGEPKDKGWEKRGIPYKVMLEAGVIVPYQEGTTKRRAALVFPCRNLETGEVTGYKTRDFTTEEKRMHTTGHYGLFSILRRGATEVVLTEGETDALSVAAALPRVSVICIPGAQRIDLLKENLSHVRRFKTIRLLFDNDDAGRSLLSKAVELLPGYKTFRVDLPDGTKDANELLLSEGELALVEAIKSSIPLGIPNTTTPDEDINLDESLDQGWTTGFPSLDFMLGGGLHPSECLALVGHTGRGKSQFVTAVTYNLLALNPGLKAFFNCTEMSHRQMANRFAQYHLERHFGLNPPTKVAKEQALRDIYRNVIFNRFPITEPQDFYDTAVRLILEEDVRVIVIDVVNDLDGFNGDWQKAGQIVKMLQRLAEGDEKENIPPVAVVSVAHTAGKDDLLTLDAIRGGASVRQVITCAVGIAGQVNETRRTLKQLKQSRNFSLGPVDDVELSYITETTRYVETNSIGHSDIRLGAREEIPLPLPQFEEGGAASSVRPTEVSRALQIADVPVEPDGPSDTEQDDKPAIHPGLPDGERSVLGSEGGSEPGEQGDTEGDEGGGPHSGASLPGSSMVRVRREEEEGEGGKEECELPGTGDSGVGAEAGAELRTVAAVEQVDTGTAVSSDSTDDRAGLPVENERVHRAVRNLVDFLDGELIEESPCDDDDEDCLAAYDAMIRKKMAAKKQIGTTHSGQTVERKTTSFIKKRVPA